MPRLRLLLADDHKMVLAAFQRMLETEFDVVGTAFDGREMLNLALWLKPDLVIADICMPRMNGLEAGRAVHQKLPSVKLVLLTVTEDPDYAAVALRAGFHGYLLKCSEDFELGRCLKAVCSGERYLTSKIANGSIANLLLEQTDEMASPASLSEREREVVHLLAEGKTMKEVGAILFMATRTVAFYKYRIMKHFHLKSSAELVQFAIRRKVIQV